MEAPSVRKTDVVVSWWYQAKFTQTYRDVGDSRIDLQEFNSTCGLVFFNVNTIILREEKIIFPMLLETLTNEEFADMLEQTIGIGLPFAELRQPELKNKDLIFSTDDKIHLPTGTLTAEQFNLIFNHLPVDITYVDENDTVRLLQSTTPNFSTYAGHYW